MKTFALVVLTVAFSSVAIAAKESKSTQAGNAISDAWANTKKLVSKKKKENCHQQNGKTVCGEKLKKEAKKTADTIKN